MWLGTTLVRTIFRSRTARDSRMEREAAIEPQFPTHHETQAEGQRERHSRLVLYLSWGPSRRRRRSSGIGRRPLAGTSCEARADRTDLSIETSLAHIDAAAPPARGVSKRSAEPRCESPFDSRDSLDRLKLSGASGAVQGIECHESIRFRGVQETHQAR
jgi:hypothetical protein